MTLVRTFHPIGQGAFYTEIHDFNGTKFTIVYDCGSTTLKKKELEVKIKSTFPKGYLIDILFISHFHADHINGIEFLAQHCKIKRVVLPLIDSSTIMLLCAGNLIKYKFSDTRLLEPDSQETFFKEFNENTDITRVKSINIERDNELINISELGPQISSGARISFSKEGFWVFIPFNYDFPTRATQFKDELKKRLRIFNFDKIETIIKAIQDKSNIKRIKKAYEKVNGNLNDNSMILFSGRNSSQNHYVSSYLFSSYSLSCPYLFCRHALSRSCLCSKCPSGCLYLGDINLNHLKIREDIRLRLSPILPNIGTLQIPHHGSIHNFDPSILSSSWKIMNAIISFGTNNTYGHPSDSVIADIVAKDVYLHLVTEEKCSIVIQKSD